MRNSLQGDSVTRNEMTENLEKFFCGVFVVIIIVKGIFNNYECRFLVDNGDILKMSLEAYFCSTEERKNKG